MDNFLNNLSAEIIASIVLFISSFLLAIFYKRIKGLIIVTAALKLINETEGEQKQILGTIKKRVTRNKVSEFIQNIKFVNQINDRTNNLTKYNIECIYENLNSECIADMKDHLAKARKVKIFVLRGLNDFGTKRSCFRDTLEEKRSSDEVKILFSSAESKFLSKDRLEKLKKSKSSMEANLKQVEDALANIRRNGINIEWRRHTETYLCKFYLFEYQINDKNNEQMAFVSFNIKHRRDDKFSPYYKINNKSNSSLYNAFDRYFDYIWESSMDNG